MMDSQPREISTRRALGGVALVLVATGTARTLAMLVAATALGLDVASSDPAARGDGTEAA